MRKLMIIHLISMLFYGFGGVWGIVEGIAYFVKDNPVNWWFLLPLVGGFLTMVVNFIFGVKKMN